ncbi:MAG: malate dehydrogenase, partial [Bdellovibrionaceae bacterium]|nr:malate dehydrogenase [Pseudobdellovibrionaceae bacterium]
MMPLVRHASVAGIPITELLSKDKISAIVTRTKQAGAEIGGHLKTGSAYYAPSRGAVEMAEAIIKDQKRVLPVAVELQGEFGVNEGLMVGVLATIGGRGVEKIHQFEMTAAEKEEFAKSVEAVRNLVATLNNIQ